MWVKAPRLPAHMAPSQVQREAHWPLSDTERERHVSIQYTHAQIMTAIIENIFCAKMVMSV